MTLTNIIRSMLLTALAREAWHRSEYHGRMRQWDEAQKWHDAGNKLWHFGLAVRRSR